VSSIVAAAYADAGDADAALKRVLAAGPVEDAAVVVRGPDGRLELRQARQTAVGEGVVGGGTIGLVLGLVFGGPIAGAVAGVAGGGAWAARDTGIPDERMRRFGRALAPGRAAVFVLVEDAGAARRALAPYEGELAVSPR
jgi:uncharacterized membrane protein